MLKAKDATSLPHSWVVLLRQSTLLRSIAMFLVVTTGTSCTPNGKTQTSKIFVALILERYPLMYLCFLQTLAFYKTILGDCTRNT